MKKEPLEYIQLQSVKELVIELKKAKQALAKAKRRIKTEITRHYFLSDLWNYDQDSHDTAGKAACKIFSKMGMEKVDFVDKNGKEDIRIVTKEDVFILELGRVSKQDKTHQVDKHKPATRRMYPNHKVHGGAIIQLEKSKKEFDKNTIDLAIDNENILFTTHELVLTYIAFKNGEIDLDQIIERMKEHGVFRVKRTR